MSHDNHGFPQGHSKRKSQFIGSSTVPAGAFLDMFVPGQSNVKVTFSDFLTAIGTTGTLTQAGAVVSTPVLNGSSPNFLIRNLEDGPGVKASVSPSNGITVEHNFTAGTVGFPLLKNPAATSPIIPSLIAGTGVSIAAGTTDLTISATGTTTPTNTQVINQESNFLVQDSTTITLSAGVRFVIGASFSTAKRFIGEEGFFLTAENAFGPVLTYTGTGDMFTTNDINFTISTITMDSPNANQTFNCSDTTNSKILGINGVIVKNTPKWGTYTGFLVTSTADSGMGDAEDGLTIAGTGQFITIINSFSAVSTTTVLNLVDLNSAVIPNIELINLSLFAPAGSVLVAGAAGSANVPSGSLAMLAGSSAAGGAVTLSGITSDDVRWRFTDNPGIPNTHPDGKLSFSGNALVTTIAAPDTPVKVNAVWNVGASSHFTADATGRITYDGETEFTAPISIAVTILMASGGDQQVTPYITIGGVPVVDTGIQITASSSKAGTATLVWQHPFQTTEFLELWVEVNGASVDVVVQQSVMLVN